MKYRTLGSIGEVSALTLGGGGIGQVWGQTDRGEAVETVKAAVDGGITFLDVAPTYGDGEAETVVGQTFNGKLPTDVRISTKCAVLNPRSDEVASRIETSLFDSFARLRIDYVDLFLLHNQIISDDDVQNYRGTTHSLFVDIVRPIFEQMVQDGKIGAWGLTGIGVPAQLLQTINEDPPPAAIQVIANLLDSPGGLRRFNEPAEPRSMMGLAQDRGIGVMGIRAVQAGALTDHFDREIASDSPDYLDYERAASFRTYAQENGATSAFLAHRYSLSIDGVSTVVLGVKNRQELSECLRAEERGPLDPDEIAEVDRLVGRV
jgi:aryl-alcohol dehydrogenase-like predicted oxidoreductase